MLDNRMAESFGSTISCAGRVCVAIEAKNADKFDPFNVPTISQLLREYEQVCEGWMLPAAVTLSRPGSDVTLSKH